MTAGKGIRRTSPLLHQFHPLTNIQPFCILQLRWLPCVVSDKTYCYQTVAAMPVLQIRGFHLAGNCKADFSDSVSCSSYLENQMGSEGALVSRWTEAQKKTVVFLFFI